MPATRWCRGPCLGQLSFVSQAELEGFQQIPFFNELTRKELLLHKALLNSEPGSLEELRVFNMRDLWLSRACASETLYKPEPYETS